MSNGLERISDPGPDVTNKITRLEGWAHSLVIQNVEQYQGSIETLKGVKAARESVVNFFSDMKAKAYATWKSITAQESNFTGRLDAVEKAAKGAILLYQRQEEEKRLAEQRRLQAIADEQARKEREKLEARATKAEEKGKEEKAEALREQAAEIIAPVVQVAPATPKMEGTSIRKIWKARVIDATLVPRQFMMVNEKALDAWAKTTKGMQPVLGVQFYEESTLAVGGIK